MDKKRADEENLMKISDSLGLENIDIVNLFRLGKPLPDKCRPLKVILSNKAHRKFLLDNGRFIPTKAMAEFRRVVITKDWTPQQREDKRKQVQQKRESIKAQQEPQRPSTSDKSPSILRPSTNANRQGIVTPSRVISMEVESLPSPVDNSTMINFSHGNVTATGTSPIHGGYNDTTIINDKTVIGGVPGPEGSPV